VKKEELFEGLFCIKFLSGKKKPCRNLGTKQLLKAYSLAKTVIRFLFYGSQPLDTDLALTPALT